MRSTTRIFPSRDKAVSIMGILPISSDTMLPAGRCSSDLVQISHNNMKGYTMPNTRCQGPSPVYAISSIVSSEFLQGQHYWPSASVTLHPGSRSLVFGLAVLLTSVISCWLFSRLLCKPSSFHGDTSRGSTSSSSNAAT